MPYQIVNGLEFYQRKEIKDVLATCTCSTTRGTTSPSCGSSTRRPADRQGDRRAAAGACPDARRCRCWKRRGESGLIEGIAKRAAVAVAKFVALFDRLGMHGRRPRSRRSWAWCSARRAISEVLENTRRRGGPGPAGEHRGAAHRGPRVRRAATRAKATWRSSWKNVCLVNDTDAWEDETGPRHADDAARRQGAGVSRGVHRRPGRGPVAARAQPPERRRSWKKSGGCCSWASRGPARNCS